MPLKGPPTWMPTPCRLRLNEVRRREHLHTAVALLVENDDLKHGESQAGIHPGAVMRRPRTNVHLEDRAGRIKRSAVPRKPPPERLHRTNMRIADTRNAAACKLSAQEADVEPDIVPDERRVADK